MMLAQISCGSFVAGIELKDDVVIKAAPVLKRMLGWSRGRVRDYCRAKGWTINVVRNE